MFKSFLIIGLRKFKYTEIYRICKKEFKKSIYYNISNWNIKQVSI